MDQEYQGRELPEQPAAEDPAEETVMEESEEEAPKAYRMPYAEDLYELPMGQVWENKNKVHKKREKREKHRMTSAAWIALVLAVALVSNLVTALVMNQSWENRFANFSLAMRDRNAALQEQIDAVSGSMAASAAGTQTVPGEWLTPSQVYQQNVDAVVTVTCYAEQNYNGQSGMYQSSGTGFIISQDGYVVSNYHVVEKMTRIEVTTTDATVYTASLVGYESTNDIALLKVDAQELPYVTIGSSSQLQVGDQVAAIGNALGELTSTMTVGYVSAKDRIVTTDGSTINMIQTDAAVNPGNSGGPLFNMQGQVVGITTAKYSGTDMGGVSIEGIGFAIPMDDVIGMIEDLRELGYISGAYLGVMVKDVDSAAQTYGLPAGAYVDEVIPGYAAEAAGLRAQDIITNLGGYDITSVSELTRMLRKFEPGETVSITVYRSGKDLQLQITLDEKPREEMQTQAQEYPMPGDEGFEDWYRQFMDDFFN